VDCATDVAPEPCKHSNVAHNEDLNAAVQAALAEAIAPVSRGTINSLARIVEATVGLMSCNRLFVAVPPLEMNCPCSLQGSRDCYLCRDIHGMCCGCGILSQDQRQSGTR